MLFRLDASVAAASVVVTAAEEGEEIEDGGVPLFSDGVTELASFDLAMVEDARAGAGEDEDGNAGEDLVAVVVVVVDAGVAGVGVGFVLGFAMTQDTLSFSLSLPLPLPLPECACVQYTRRMEQSTPSPTKLFTE